MADVNQGLTNQDAINQADQDRTKRVFVGLLTSALGMDQLYTTDDTAVMNPTGQYVIANPDGTYSVLGKSVSNVNQQPVQAGGLSPLLVLLLVAAGFFFLKKG